MFTGIIEALGEVVALEGLDLTIRPKGSLGNDPIVIGESIAINGCCLTVVASDGTLHFNLSPETLSRTSIGDLAVGSAVNLERAMRADGRFGGHLVQGHVDGTGSVVSITSQEGATVIRFEVPEGGQRYLIDKGSVSIDGISLTVVTPKNRQFDTWIIPHTLANTNLGDRKPGDRVNLEYDVLARYVERLLTPIS